MPKSPRKAAPKRPPPTPEPTFATLGTTLGAASVPGALGGAMDAALGFPARGLATLAAVPVHPALRLPPPPVPFCRQITICRAPGGFMLFPLGSLFPENAIAVASTPLDLLARIEEWAGKSEPEANATDTPF
jgi:hypothetical protein